MLDSLRRETADDGVQSLGLRYRQRRGRLIHNEDACILRQRLRYLDELLLADTQTAHRCVGRGLEVECVEDARGGACLGIPVNEKRYPAHLLVPEENVLRNCHGRDKIEFLVDHGDPSPGGVPRAGEPHWFTENRHLAAVIMIDPASDFHECGFSGSILTHKGMDFAGPKVKINVPQHVDFAKCLAHPLHDQGADRGVDLIFSFLSNRQDRLLERSRFGRSYQGVWRDHR